MTLPTQMTNHDLAAALSMTGLTAVSQNLDDLIARFIKGRWSAQNLLEEVCRIEDADRARRSLERRLRASHIGRFKQIADFDWNWPTEIDRELIERALTLEFVREGRNLILVGNNGLGKTPRILPIQRSWPATRFYFAVPLRSSRVCSATPPKQDAEGCAPMPGPLYFASMRSAICPTTATQLTCCTRSSIAATSSGPFS